MWAVISALWWRYERPVGRSPQ